MSVPPGSAGHRGRLRRWFDAALAVAIWMALGWALRVDANGYLLLGVPITVAFQLWISRRPLHTLWVRDADRFRLDRRGVLLAAALAATPATSLATHVATAPRPDWVRVAWLLAAVVGAVGAAFAFRRFTRETLRSLLACVGTAGLIGIALMMATRFAGPADSPLTARVALTGVRWFLLYLPVTFVLEEVFFRGALDGHVYRVGESRGLVSAVFVSALWGLWHLPVTSARASFPITMGGLLFVHVAIGVPLSVYWRRSGNLAVPGTVHALIDSVRNTLLSANG